MKILLEHMACRWFIKWCPTSLTTYRILMPKLVNCMLLF